METPLISIIVPVYKVEKYIKECINSIIDQTYKNWELILIDDGTPDQAGVICDQYAQKDQRISVIHKINAGVSAARNTGLEIAKGEWITFIDSDDWIEKDCFECSVKEILDNHLDLLQFSYRRINDSYQTLFYNQTETTTLIAHDYISANKFLYCAGGSLFKAKIIKQNKLQFNTQIKLGEDQLFIFTYMAKCNFCKRIDNLYYNYRYNNESASVISKPEDCIKSIIFFQNYHMRKLFEKQIQKSIYMFVLSIVKSKKIPLFQLYNIIKKESFKLVKPTRKIDTLFLNSYNISKLAGLIILYRIRTKI